MKGSGYSAFVKSFVVFFSDIEDNPRFKKIVKKFDKIDSLEKLK